MPHVRFAALLCPLALLAAGEAAPALPAAPAAPAPAAAPAPELTLAQALQSALQRNETGLIARERLEQAQARYRLALAAFMPRLAASGGWNHGWESDPPFAAAHGAWWSAGASVSLPLFDPAAFPGLQAARAQREARRLLSSEERRQLSYATARSYLAVLGTEQALAAAVRRRALAQQTLDTARTRFDAGLAAQGDVNRTELELARAELTRTETARARDAARIGLAELVVEPGARHATLPAPGIAAPAARDPLPLIDAARMHRDDLQAQHLAVAAANAEARANLAQGLPTLDASAGVGRTWSDEVAQYDVDENEWRAALTLRWDLYDGGSRYARADEAKARAREIAAELARNQRNLGSEIDTALVELAAAEDSVRQGEVQDRAAKANAADVDVRFKAGLATALETADASAQAFTAETDLVRARFRLELARLELRAIGGQWPLTDTDPTERR